MNELMWIVALVGEHVHHGHANQCVISDINKLDDVRKKIKAEHGLEFSEYNSSPCSMYWRRYENISDARDISLLVERTFVFTEKDLPLNNMKTKHVNNLISLVAVTVDQIHRSTDNLEYVEASLHMRTDLYGDLPEVIIQHIGSCLVNIKRCAEQTH